MLQRKLLRICQVLDHYFPDPPIPLNHSNGFTFLVAVVLSAQTTDGKVNEVTRELFRHADNPEAMSRLTPEFVESVIKPVGLAPRKAQSVVGLSRMIVERFQGEVPRSFEELESLPGVGHKTASVIMSQLFGVHAFAVDTHVHRLALRWGLTKEQNNPDKVQQDLCRLFPESSWSKLHLQMIYFGREYCTAKNHQNASCPICSWVHQKEDEDDRPRSPPSQEQMSCFTPQKRVKGLVYYSDRVSEVTNNPSLTPCSPVRTIKRRNENEGCDDADMSSSRIDLSREFSIEEKASTKVKDEPSSATAVLSEVTATVTVDCEKANTSQGRARKRPSSALKEFIADKEQGSQATTVPTVMTRSRSRKSF